MTMTRALRKKRKIVTRQSTNEKKPTSHFFSCTVNGLSKKKMDRVKVAIRVRPLCKAEKDCDSANIVNVNGNQLVLTNPNTKDDRASFAFDHVYDTDAQQM